MNFRREFWIEIKFLLYEFLEEGTLVDGRQHYTDEQVKEGKRRKKQTQLIQIGFKRQIYI